MVITNIYKKKRYAETWICVSSFEGQPWLFSFSSYFIATFNILCTKVKTIDYILTTDIKFKSYYILYLFIKSDFLAKNYKKEK